MDVLIASAIEFQINPNFRKKIVCYLSPRFRMNTAAGIFEVLFTVPLLVYILSISPIKHSEFYLPNDINGFICI